MHVSGFAVRALAQVDSVHPFDPFRCGFGFLRGHGLADEFPDAGYGFFPPGIAQITVVPDAGEARWQGVQEKAAQELGALQRERFLSGGVFGITMAESDGLVRDLDDALVGDADLVGISAQIGEYLPGAREGAFGEDDPLFWVQGIEQALKSLWLMQFFELAMELQLSFLVQLRESFEENGAVHPGESPHGEQPFSLTGPAKGFPIV